MRMDMNIGYDELLTGTRLEVRRIEDPEDATVVSQLLAPLAGPLALIAVPISKQQLVNWENGTSLLACFIQKGHGIWSFTASIVSRTENSGVQALLVQLDNAPMRFQRRSYFRLDCTLDMAFRRFPEREVSNKNKTEAKTPSRPGVTRNISGGGASFVAIQMDDPPEEIELVLSIEGIGPIIARGRVLRHEEVEYERVRRQQFSVEFTEISAEDRESLVRYVFRRQRRRLYEN